MSGGGSKTQSTTTSSPQLPANVKGAMDSSLGKAQSLFNNNQIATPYTGSTVVPYSSQTRTGMTGIADNVNGFSDDLRSGFQHLSAAALGDGFNTQQRGAIDKLQATYNAAQGSNADSNLAAFARGDYLDGSNNPYFSQVVDRASEGARDAVNMNFSGAGRYGSGANQQILAREVGDLQNRAYAGQYNNEVANMFGANQQMDSQRLANLGLRSSTAGDIFNAGQQGYSNKMSAINALPSAFQGTLAPFQAMMGVGAMNEDLSARNMNDQLRIWQEQQQQPMKSVEWLNGIAGGNGALTGGRTQTIQTPKTSPFMAGLGGAVAGGTAFGPIGAAIGGGAGLLSGLWD